ncbi:MAG: Vitamin K-dependent gamma-carboxylase [Pseudomonadota bacterium]|jgi:hypothetical protein
MPASHILARLHTPGSPRQLALVRIAVCVHVASVLMSPALDAIFVVPAHVMPWAESALPLGIEKLATKHVGLIAKIGFVAALFGAFGLLSRLALAITGLSFFLTQDVWFRMSLFHDDWLYFNAYLLILACSPSADAWSLDRVRKRARGEPPARGNAAHRLATELMVLWFSGVYVAAGVAKLFPLVKVWGWLSGARAQAFAIDFLLDSPIYWMTHAPAFDYPSTRWPFALGAWYTILTELGAASLVLTTRYRWLVLPAIVGLHLSVLLFGIPGFVQTACIAMTVFVPASWLGSDEPASP